MQLMKIEAVENNTVSLQSIFGTRRISIFLQHISFSILI